jgi:hypothetical protein
VDDHNPRQGAQLAKKGRDEHSARAKTASNRAKKPPFKRCGLIGLPIAFVCLIHKQAGRKA